MCCDRFSMLDLGTTSVCNICGLQIQKPHDPAIGSSHCGDGLLFITHYSRLNRFLKLLTTIVLPHPVSKDSLMLEYLKGKTFVKLDELLKHMQKTMLEATQKAMIKAMQKTM